MCHLLGIKKTRTTPYHPQSDGLVEHLNRTLLTILSIAAAECEQEWDLRLPVVMLAYHSSVQETTGATPFSVMFGREVCLPIDLMFDTPPDYPPPSSTSGYAQTLREHLQEAYHFVRDHIKSRQFRQEELYDRRIGGDPCLVNDCVWLHCPAIPKGQARKFHRPWQGPFRVVTVLSDAVYRIQRGCYPQSSKKSTMPQLVVTSE